tara:strand:- start:199 stop:597 length:399 start_codon:yes stop_codon:yes gene_type:complete
MQPSGAKRNSEDHATFSKAGPYLRSPDTTSNPNVIPKAYRLNKSNINAGPKFNKETPKNGDASSTAGTIPIKVLIKAVAVSPVIISLTLSGAINKFVKFLLQISSRNNILKLMLERNKKSYRIAALKIIPTV